MKTENKRENCEIIELNGKEKNGESYAMVKERDFTLLLSVTCLNL